MRGSGIIKAIILAAGYATRLYPLTLNTAKALLPINNKPIINYTINELNKIKAIDKIYVVSNDRFYNDFCTWQKNVETIAPIEILNDKSKSEEDRLGAIGDIQFCIEQKNINEDTIIIAGDNFFTSSLKPYYDFFKENNKDCVCVKEFFDKEKIKQFAVANLDASGKITNLEEKPKYPKSNIAVYACYIYKKNTIALFETYLQEGNKKDAPGHFVEWLYKRKPVLAYKINGECYDIGTIESYEEVKSLSQVPHKVNIIN